MLSKKSIFTSIVNNSPTRTLSNQQRLHSNVALHNIHFTPAVRNQIRNRLNKKSSNRYQFNWGVRDKKIDEAAVLVPLCTVNGKSSVVFTIRSRRLTSHGGEVSLPGGRRDPEDKTVIDTALRETYEEINILPSEIEILGQHAALPSVDKSLIIYPIVGYIKQPVDVNDIKYNQNEVSGVFTLTLDDLLNPTNRTRKRFRDTNYYYTTFQTPPWIGIEIWGLTAFIISGVLKTICEPPLIP